MIAASVLALGVAVERLVSGPLPDGIEIVLQPAYAALPEESEPPVQDTRTVERQLEDGLWSAAFGTPAEPEAEPEMALLEEEVPEEELEAAPEGPVETTEYWLTGLINGEGLALALVHDGAEEQVVHLGSGLSGGETVVKIEKQSILARRDGETIRIGFPDEEENW